VKNPITLIVDWPAKSRERTKTVSPLFLDGFDSRFSVPVELFSLTSLSSSQVLGWNSSLELQESETVAANNVDAAKHIKNLDFACSLKYGSAAAKSASKRPDQNTLRPDFELRVSKFVATASPL
jgi:hypothetical protein